MGVDKELAELQSSEMAINEDRAHEKGMAAYSAVLGSAMKGALMNVETARNIRVVIYSADTAYEVAYEKAISPDNIFKRNPKS